MPLEGVININPGDDDMTQWAWNHYLDHLDIRSAIQSQRNFNLELLEIDEINFQNLQDWLERHQLMHNNFNSVLKLDGNDLTQVNFQDLGQRESWLWLNFYEHRNARAALKI